MTFTDDAIKLLYGGLAIKRVENPESKLPYEAFVKYAKDGTILGVVISNDHAKNKETGKPEVVPPPVPEGHEYAYLKPNSNIDLQKKRVNMDTGTLEVKP